MKSIKYLSDITRHYKSSSGCSSTDSIDEDFSFDELPSRHHSVSYKSVINFDNDSSEASTDFSETEFKRNEVDFIEDEIKNINDEIDTNRPCHNKSLLSLINVFKNFSLSKKNETTKGNNNNNSIYRQLKRPTDYVYFKGMSGLSNRIEKRPLSAKCNRCTMRNG